MALLLFLIIKKQLPAFVALLLVSVVIGLGAQFPHLDPEAVLDSMTRGMGGTLGFVAVVVGLGAMFGKMLEVSGGAEVLAHGLLQRFGTRRAPWALGVAGFCISVPVFFDVAFVVLTPILYGLSERARVPLLHFAIPLLAGMVVTHSFVPPTPGPIGVAAILEADLGYVIWFGVLAGLPAMCVAGPLFARWIAKHVEGRIPAAFEPEANATVGQLPSFGLVGLLIALPIALIVAGTITATLTRDGSWVPSSTLTELGRDLIVLFGHPFVALLVTTLACFRWLGTKRGMSRQDIQQVATAALEPAGIIILVTGAGGVLKQVLIDTQVGTVLADQLVRFGAAPVLLSFLLALVVRVLQGSATVAMLTAAGLVVPLLEATNPSIALRSLLVVPIAAGASCLSHVNDSGFWLVSRYLGLSVPETLKSWTAMTTLLGLTGLVVALLLSAFIG